MGLKADNYNFDETNFVTLFASNQTILDGFQICENFSILQRSQKTTQVGPKVDGEHPYEKSHSNG